VREKPKNLNKTVHFAQNSCFLIHAKKTDKALTLGKNLLIKKIFKIISGIGKGNISGNFRHAKSFMNGTKTAYFDFEVHNYAMLCLLCYILKQKKFPKNNGF